MKHCSHDTVLKEPKSLRSVRSTDDLLGGAPHGVPFCSRLLLGPRGVLQAAVHSLGVPEPTFTPLFNAALHDRIPIPDDSPSVVPRFSQNFVG
jgi:hypothetical protein